MSTTVRSEEPDQISYAIARDCAVVMQGCITDDKYNELVSRIANAIQAERDDHKATIRQAGEHIRCSCEDHGRAT